MGSPNQLSFLPDDYLARKAQRRTNTVCAVFFVLAMGGVVAAFVVRERAFKRTDTEYAQVEDQYLREAKRLEQVRQMQEKQKRMARQAELTASLLERIPRSYILAELTNSLPPNVSLLDFYLESRPRVKAAAPVAGKTAYEQKKAAKEIVTAGPAAAEPRHYDVYLKLSGIATTDVQVAAYLKKLSNSALFKDVNLVITDEFKQADEKLRKFQIEMMLNTDAEVHGKGAATANVELKE